MVTQLIPLFGHHHGAPFLFLGGPFLFLLLLAALGTFLFLKRRRFQRPEGGGLPWQRSPEHEAQTILAERFARGEMDTNEFMERAAALNWTPGVRPNDGHDHKKK